MRAREDGHLREVGSNRLAEHRGCRTVYCSFARKGALGFCTVCEAACRAAVVLRERLLAHRRAQLRAARPALFDHMGSELGDRLLAQVAAQAHRGSRCSVLELAGLEDFVAELGELDIKGLT